MCKEETSQDQEVAAQQQKRAEHRNRPIEILSMTDWDSCEDAIRPVLLFAFTTLLPDFKRKWNVPLEDKNASILRLVVESKMVCVRVCVWEGAVMLHFLAACTHVSVWPVCRQEVVLARKSDSGRRPHVQIRVMQDGEGGRQSGRILVRWPCLIGAVRH